MTTLNLEVVAPKESKYIFEVSLNETRDLDGHWYDVSIAGKDIKTKYYVFDTMVGEGNYYGYRKKSDANKLFKKTVRDLKAGVNYHLLEFRGSPDAKIKNSTITKKPVKVTKYKRKRSVVRSHKRAKPRKK